MTLTIDLSPESVRALEEKARATGLTVTEFATALLTQVACSPLGSPERLAEIAARLAALQQIGAYDTRVRAGLPPLSDENISRGSTYEGRGV
jgi:hypothetical protein